METPARAGAPEAQDDELDNPVSRAPASPATHHRYRKTDRRQAPKLTLAEPIEVKKFFCNRKGDIVVISICQIEDGPPFLDIRKFFTDKNGIMRPTRKGLSLAIIRAPELHAGIGTAVETARRLGFLKGGGDE